MSSRDPGTFWLIHGRRYAIDPARRYVDLETMVPAPLGLDGSPGTQLTVVSWSHDELADWLGDQPEAHNVFDLTDEATTVIEIGVDDLAHRLLAALTEDR